jgi:hypothetical protein
MKIGIPSRRILGKTLILPGNLRDGIFTGTKTVLLENAWLIDFAQ